MLKLVNYRLMSRLQKHHISLAYLSISPPKIRLSPLHYKLHSIINQLWVCWSVTLFHPFPLLPSFLACLKNSKQLSGCLRGRGVWHSCQFFALWFDIVLGCIQIWPNKFCGVLLASLTRSLWFRPLPLEISNLIYRS